MTKLPPGSPFEGKRWAAYKAGARIARERIERDAPLDAEALRRVEASDIVVVRGSYDRVEQVLDALDLPRTTVNPQQVAELPLRPEQLLVINCPGQIDRRAVERVRAFVEEGGSLFTTDWALRLVIERAFPGVLAYNERPTRDAVVRIEVRGHDNPFLAGVMDGDDDPQWWLEGSSYPIRVLDRDRVEVLLASRELEQHWGESPIAVLFRHGDGEVFHMISHYYLQRTELRGARHATKADAYAIEKGVSVQDDLEGLELGEVESAQSSARLLTNAVLIKKRHMMKMRERLARRDDQDQANPG